jgi:hypothetical protein
MAGLRPYCDDRMSVGQVVISRGSNHVIADGCAHVADRQTAAKCL